MENVKRYEDAYFNSLVKGNRFECKKVKFNVLLNNAILECTSDLSEGDLTL